MFRLFAITVTAAVVLAETAAAHHSFAMFDPDKKVTVSGTVKKFDWKNPHVFLDISVVEAGQTKALSFEGYSPAQMAKQGWARTSLKPGDTVTVLYNPLRSDTWGGALLTVTTADGKVLGKTSFGPQQ